MLLMGKLPTSNLWLGEHLFGVVAGFGSDISGDIFSRY